MADLITRTTEVWPSDVVFDLDTKIHRQFEKYVYFRPVSGKTYYIEHCLKRAANYTLIRQGRRHYVEIQLSLETIATRQGTLRRVQTQLDGSVEQKFQSELERFCACRENRFEHCCRDPLDSRRLHCFLDVFLSETAQDAGFKLLAVTYRITAAV